jgi:hypothetical protein
MPAQPRLIDRTCLTCNQTFEVRPTNAKKIYCSTNCRVTAYDRRKASAIGVAGGSNGLHLTIDNLYGGITVRLPFDLKGLTTDKDGEPTKVNVGRHTTGRPPRDDVQPRGMVRSIVWQDRRSENAAVRYGAKYTATVTVTWRMCDTCLRDGRRCHVSHQGP